MTATWILIVYVSTGHAGGPTTAEFFSKERCEAAGQAVEEKFVGLLRTAKWICVEK